MCSLIIYGKSVLFCTLITSHIKVLFCYTFSKSVLFCYTFSKSVFLTCCLTQLLKNVSCIPDVLGLND